MADTAPKSPGTASAVPVFAPVVRERVYGWLRRYGLDDALLQQILAPFIVRLLSAAFTKQFDLKAQLLSLVEQLPSEPLVGREKNATAFWRELKARTDRIQTKLPATYDLASQPNQTSKALSEFGREVKTLVRTQCISGLAELTLAQLDLISPELADQVKSASYAASKQQKTAKLEANIAAKRANQMEKRQEHKQKGSLDAIGRHQLATSVVELEGADSSSEDDIALNLAVDKASVVTPKPPRSPPGKEALPAPPAASPKTPAVSKPLVDRSFGKHALKSRTKLQYEAAAEQAIVLSDEYRSLGSKLKNDMEMLISKGLLHHVFQTNSEASTELDRYEFYGDAVLAYKVARVLTKSNLLADPRQLRSICNVVVSNVNLAKIFDSLSLAELFYKHGIQPPETKGKADFIEALFGEIDYLLNHSPDGRYLSHPDRSLAETFRDNLTTFAIHLGEASYLQSPLPKKLAAKPQMMQVRYYTPAAVREVVIVSDEEDSEDDEDDLIESLAEPDDTNDTEDVQVKAEPTIESEQKGDDLMAVEHKSTEADHMAVEPPTAAATLPAATSASQPAAIQAPDKPSSPSERQATAPAPESPTAESSSGLLITAGRWTPFTNRIHSDDGVGDVEMADATPVKSPTAARFKLRSSSLLRLDKLAKRSKPSTNSSAAPNFVE